MTLSKQGSREPFTTDDYITYIDYDSGTNPVYIGRAEPGTATSAAGWQIRKITYSGDDPTTVLFADGTNEYIKVWDDRATYTYS